MKKNLAVYLFFTRMGLFCMELFRFNLSQIEYSESFNGKLRGELLDGNTFYTLKEAKIII